MIGAIESEKQLLGALMVQPVLRDTVIATESDFEDSRHRAIVSELYEVDQLDPLLLVKHLEKQGKLTTAGGLEYVMSLAQDVIVVNHAGIYLRDLRNRSMRRRVKALCDSIVQRCQEPVGNEAEEREFLAEIESSVLEITSQRERTGIRTMAEMKPEIVAYLKAMMQTGGLSGLPTGFREIDKLTMGLLPGCLYVIAARPGLGKTTLALNIAANVSMRFKRHSVIFSLEMSYLELLSRLLSAESRIELNDIKSGRLMNRTERLKDSIEEILASKLAIDETGTLEIRELKSRAVAYKNQLERRGQKLSLLVVDYLQLVSDPDARRSGRANEVGSVSRGLKQLAKALNCPVIAVAQINRDAEKAKRPPQLSDLRESGAIEADADFVAFLHKEDQMQFLARKNRHGPTAEINLEWLPGSFTFQDGEL